MSRKNIVVENAKIGFRNFAGEAGRFNPAGRRNFCIFLDEQVASQMEEDGWNIKWLQPKDEGDNPVPYIQVTVRFDNVPPRIYLVSSKGKTVLDEESVKILDFAEIDFVDLTITPYDWEFNGKSGVKAYLKTMYVTIVEDEFEKKYRDVPDSASDSIGGCGGCEACDGSCHGH